MLLILLTLFLGLYSNSANAFTINNHSKNLAIAAYSIGLKANTYKELIPPGKSGHCDEVGLFCHIDEETPDSIVVIYEGVAAPVIFLDSIIMGVIFSADRQIAALLNLIILYQTGIPFDSTRILIALEDLLNSLAKMNASCAKIVPHNATLEYYGNGKCEVVD